MTVHRLARNSVFGALAGVCSSLGSFASSVLVARLLGVDGTGAVALGIWIATTAATLADLGIPASLARYLPELNARGEAAQGEALAASLLKRSLLAVVVIVVGGACYAGWGLLRAPGQPGTFSVSTDPTALLLVGVCCGLQGLAGFANGYLRGMQRFDRLAILTLACCAIQLGTIGLGGSTLGVYGVLAGYAASYVPMAAMAFSGKRPGEAVAAPVWARVRRYALYSWAAGAAAAFVWARVEVLFLARSWGEEAVGMLTVGLTLSNMATQGPLLLTTGLLPFFAERYGASEFGLLRDAHAMGTRLMALLMFPACFGTAAIMPLLLPLIYGHAFQAAVPTAEVLVIAAALSTATVGSNIVYAMERSDFIFWCGMVGIVLSVALGLTVIPAFGPIGAAWSRAGVQLVVVAIGQWFIGRRLAFPLPYAALSRLLLSALLCAFAARLVVSLWPEPWAMPVAILTGAVVYLGAVRFTGALPQGDADRLVTLVEAMSGSMGWIAVSALRLLIKQPKPLARSASTGVRSTPP